MQYQTIAAKFKGIHEYDQGAEAVAQHIAIGNGVCRALCVMWLRAKKDGTPFWSDANALKQPLLADIRRLQNAVQLQREYEAVTQGRLIPDQTTSDELKKSGLTYSQADVTASAQQGYAQRLPSDEPAKIVTQVLGSPSRCFILSIKGASGAHSIGLYRPYSVLGTSSQFCLFDPNIGEFCADGKSQAEALLVAVNGQGYPRMDLNKSYILWSYAG
ncbi:MAG: YopT-type cysteine protease domain-containing protein [Pseudomonadota bacterium]